VWRTALPLLYVGHVNGVGAVMGRGFDGEGEMMGVKMVAVVGKRIWGGCVVM